MKPPLEGRTALVTGASGPLGSAVCQALAERGADVIGTWHRGEQRATALRERSLQDGLGVRLLQVDLTEPGAAAALIRRTRELGDPDVLVCAHGATRRRGVLQPGAAESPLWTLNVSAGVELAAAAAKPMLRRKFGRIILLGSRAGAAGMPGQSEYAATKAALSGWAASAAWELGPFGITVNVVAPGALEPGPDAVYSAEEDELATSRTALRRLGTADEVAATVAFLAEPGAGYVSGQTILVDGGARW